MSHHNVQHLLRAIGNLENDNKILRRSNNDKDAEITRLMAAVCALQEDIARHVEICAAEAGMRCDAEAARDAALKRAEQAEAQVAPGPGS